MKKAPPNTPKYQISDKSVRGFGSYEHLKFRPMCRQKNRLWRHNDVIVVTSQTFFLPLCWIHQAWHLCQISWSSEQQQQSYDGGPHAPPHDWRFKKSPRQIGLRCDNHIEVLFQLWTNPWIFGILHTKVRPKEVGHCWDRYWNAPFVILVDQAPCSTPSCSVWSE